MSADTFLPWALSVALLSVRLTVAVALSPVFSAYGVPALVRTFLVLALAVLTSASHPPAAIAVMASAGTALLIPAVLAEIMTGALLGLGVHLSMAAVAIAGRLLDVQIGFGLGAVFDPVTRSSSSVLASLASLLGVTLFVTSDAPLHLAQLIARSLEVLPLGVLPSFDDPLRQLSSAGEMFTLALALAAPVVAAMLLVDVAMAVMSRNMPQINVLILAMPLKVLVGYFMLILSLGSWLPLLQQAFGRLGLAGDL
jgi:flagellar biosynthetic protein FliR